MSDSVTFVNRRTFLRGALATGAGAALAALSALAARRATAGPGQDGGKRPTGAGYGPLLPVRDQTTGWSCCCYPRVRVRELRLDATT